MAGDPKKIWHPAWGKSVVWPLVVTTLQTGRATSIPEAVRVVMKELIELSNVPLDFEYEGVPRKIAVTPEGVQILEVKKG